MIHNPKPSVLVVLIAGIGDLVLASPGLRAIRNGWKDAEIYLLTSSDAAPLAELFPYVDHVHAFPIREMRKGENYLFRMLHVVRDVRRIRFNLCVNLYQIGSWSGAVKMGILFSLIRAKRKIGHDKAGFGLFLTERIASDAFRGRHIVETMQAISVQCGGIPDNRGVEVFWNPNVSAKWAAFFSQMPGRKHLGINPGSDRQNKRWAPERLAAVTSEIIRRFDADVILLGGPSDGFIVASIENRIRSECVINLSGKIPLEELPYVISRLDLLLTNDSGPMHIAAATKTPIVGIFGPEDPKLFGPYTTPALYRVIQKDTPCRPCRDDRCAHPSCLDLITPEEVLVACIELLNNKIMRDIPHH